MFTVFFTVHNAQLHTVNTISNCIIYHVHMAHYHRALGTGAEC